MPLPPRRSARAAAAAAAAALLAAAAALAVLPGSASADDSTGLLANGGFESGTTAGWTCGGRSGVTAGAPHSGTYALVSAPTGSDTAACSQTVAVRPGGRYALSVWVKGPYAQVSVSGAGVSRSTWASATAWTPLSLDVTAAAATTSLTVTVSGWYASGAVSADDAVLSGPEAGSTTAPTAPPTTAPPTSPATPTATPTTPTTTGAPPAGQVVQVTDGTSLKAALAAARPGQTISLADGTYTGNFKITTAGTAAAPIVLTGSRAAVLTTSSGGGNAVQLTSSPYWTIRGVTLTHAQKGIMIDSSDHVTVDGVEVYGTTMEGIHFRTSSSYGVVQNSFVHDTGTSGNGMGEGVYVGTANTLTDTSDHVRIVDNVIGPNVGGENIDVKEGTTGGVISGNTFDGSGLTGANYDDSWVDVKGNGYTVTGNRGSRTSNDGFQTHSQYDGWGCGTVFRGNSSDLTGATGPDRYAIHVTNYDATACPVTVAADNTVTGGNGLVNPGVPVG